MNYLNDYLKSQKCLLRKNISTLDILLGAGFSKGAGLPLGAQIKDKLNDDLVNKIKRLSSSEWKWIEQVSNYKHPAPLLADKDLLYGFVLNECLNTYIKKAGTFIDYEDYYQFIKDLQPNSKDMLSIFHKAVAELIKKYPVYKQKKFDYITKRPDQFVLPIILNHLIESLLRIKVDDEVLKVEYKTFLELTKSFKRVNIFTLNHDLLVEKLFDIFSIEYSTGFSILNSDIYYDGNPLETFQDKFTKKIRLFKLHGSIDTFKFQHRLQQGSSLGREEGFSYYKAPEYRQRHAAYRVNTETLETVQDYSPDSAVPAFITGKRKLYSITSDYMYSSMYKTLRERMKRTKNLFISGYSFGDDHINSAIKLNNARNIINHNLTDNYPFSKKAQYSHINDLNDLPSIL